MIVVASVSCIYGMGNPEEYRGQLLERYFRGPVGQGGMAAAARVCVERVQSSRQTPRCAREGPDPLPM